MLKKNLEKIKKKMDNYLDDTIKEIKDINYFIITKGPEYLTENNKWSSNFNKAHDFNSKLEAEEKIRTLKLRKANIRTVWDVCIYKNNYHIEYRSEVT